MAYDEDLDLAVMKIKYFIEEDKNKITFEQFKDEYEIFLPSAYVPELFEGYGLSIGESITILGYPATGGNSINYTKGTVSGFESLYYEDEYYEWRVKTDADIDHGSSGGAAFDEFNNFVGIPTEIAVDSDSVGYLISLPIINYFLLANDIVLAGASGMCFDLENGYFDPESDDCFCHDDYDWDDDTFGCMPISEEGDSVNQEPITKEDIDNQTAKVVTDQTNDAYVQSEIDLLQSTDVRLVDRLIGRILLQVEDHGEAWYLDPTTKNRFYMKDGPTAYEMLRAFGLGITNADLENLKNGDTNLVNRLKGRIVLQVEAHGEAYYINPADGMVIYMKDGAEAYRLMRYHSLGIKNTDLAHIPIKKFTPVD
ncbi:MAG: serine protease [Patescibacteria group bacterium]|nr:serine protease [Patescibacteria group bacterium]